MDYEKLCDGILKRIDDEEKDSLVIQRAKRDAKYQFYKTLFLRSFVQDFMDDGKVPDEARLTQEDKRIIQKQALRNATKPPYVFLTVSPRPDVDLETFKKAIEKFIQRKMISRYAYVYEVRNCENGVYTGLHAHLMTRYMCRPHDYMRGAKSTFKHVCDVNNSEILNIKYIPEEVVSEKIDYILGNKKKSKEKGVVFSREYRTANNLIEIYESNPPLSCRVAKPNSLE